MKNRSYKLLNSLCKIHAPSGNESAMTEFLLEYINFQSKNWKTKPVIYQGEDFQNCIVLVFGKPKVAVYAHIDNIGFMTRYDNELVRIGSPKMANGYKLTGLDSKGAINCELIVDEETNEISADFKRIIDTGTDLSFENNFREDTNYIQSSYLDNRLGVFVALQVAETIQNGAIVFSCWEEHGGGSAAFLAKFLYEKYKIHQSLICDITWVTTGVHAGKGVAVSIRDSGIPRRIFVDKIRQILTNKNIPFQIEVESSGGSDGNEIQKLPYPIDWCFIGAPEEFVHSPDEKVHKDDVESMIAAYQILVEEL